MLVWHCHRMRMEGTKKYPTMSGVTKEARGGSKIVQLSSPGNAGTEGEGSPCR